MTRFYWIEIEDDIKRRIEVLENDDVIVYINTKRRRAKDEGAEAAVRIVEG